MRAEYVWVNSSKMHRISSEERLKAMKSLDLRKNVGIAVAACLVVVALAMTGCSGSGESANSSSASSQNSSPDSASTQTTTQSSKGLGEAGFDGFDIVLDSVEIGTDESTGGPALLLNYTCTNNTGEIDDFYHMMIPYAYQNGEEIFGAVVYTDDTKTETTFDVASKQIENGQTVQITDAFQLLNTTDPVEIQFNNLHHDDVQTITVDLSKATTK